MIEVGSQQLVKLGQGKDQDKDKGSVERLLQLRRDDRPMGLVLDALRKRLHVSNGRGGRVAVITLVGEPPVLQESAVGKRPRGIALSYDGRRLHIERCVDH